MPSMLSFPTGHTIINPPITTIQNPPNYTHTCNSSHTVCKARILFFNSWLVVSASNGATKGHSLDMIN